MCPIRTALVLAAGRGVRMGQDGRVIPKGFIEIGGTPLIRRSIRLLAAHGITSIVIVTGHLRGFYDALAEEHAGEVTCLYNENFATKGSFESLLTGMAHVAEPFLLLESDIIYEAGAIEALLGHPSESAILVSGRTGAGDEVHVWAEALPDRNRMRFISMSKNRHKVAREPYGELVGITKIGTVLRAGMVESAAFLHAAAPQAEYEYGLVSIADRLDIDCVKIPDLVWGEIDDHSMLERVRRDVFPRLAATGCAGRALGNEDQQERLGA